MILDMKPLTLGETKELIPNLDEKKELNDYFKNFAKLSAKDAVALKEKIMQLNNHKIKEEHAVKIVDFVPADSEDLHKIFSDLSLSEDESKAILSLVAGA